MILYPAFLPILSTSTTEDEAIRLNPKKVRKMAIVKIANLALNFILFSFLHFILTYIDEVYHKKFTKSIFFIKSLYFIAEFCLLGLNIMESINSQSE